MVSAISSSSSLVSGSVFTDGDASGIGGVMRLNSFGVHVAGDSVKGEDSVEGSVSSDVPCDSSESSILGEAFLVLGT
jgi:hypothetical protein